MFLMLLLGIVRSNLWRLLFGGRVLFLFASEILDPFLTYLEEG